MPFLGLATKGDLERAQQCTMVARGISWCTHPKFDVVSAADMTQGRADAVSTDRCYNVKPLMTTVGGMPSTIPDHYVCVEKGTLDSYGLANPRMGLSTIANQIPGALINTVTLLNGA